ncbi:unnamed protein product [Lathyrus oleraceus]
MDSSPYVKHIIKGTPWIFISTWLAIKQWNPDDNSTKLNFNIVPIRVEIWGIPLKIRTKHMGFKIALKLGKVMES